MGLANLRHLNKLPFKGGKFIQIFTSGTRTMSVVHSVLSPLSSRVDNPNLSAGTPCCFIVGVSRDSSHTSVLYACKVEDGSIAEGNPICLVKPDGKCIWENKEINKGGIVVGSILKYRIIRDLYIYVANTKKRMDVDKIQMDLEYGVSAYKGIKDACPEAIITEKMGCYLPPRQHIQIFLIAIAGGFIGNERITLVTKSGEFVNFQLNCREHLTMSASPSVLQSKPLTEEDDVGDVAVIKCDSATKYARAVCDCLILKYKPKVISIDEEPVKIKNADGVFVLCPGVVTFDTGNTVATSISKELVNILKLEDKIDHTKRLRYTAAGRDANGNPNHGVSSRVWIDLKIRRRVFPVFALVNAAVKNVDLLIGMDVISKLNDENFTLGK